MKLVSLIRSLLPAGLFLAFLSPVFAQYTNGQNAFVVLGQNSFTTSTPGTTQSFLRGEFGIVVDNASGKVFVVDTANNRVLRFKSVDAFQNGPAAEAVFGQANFTTSATGTANTNLNNPNGAALDSAGNLWVADTNNNRVVCFADALNASSSTPAAIVLGQANFGTNTADTSQVGMRAPSGVAIDSNDSLYVLDGGNNRILRFDNVTEIASNGIQASGLLGQTNYLFGTANAGTTTNASGISGAAGLSVDGSGNLWVADTLNNRVLLFKSPSSLANGAAASGVVGQTDFISSSSAVSASKFLLPIGVTFDTAGRLYVSDLANRVLVFQQSLTAPSGPSASFVLGQTSFTANTAGTTQNTFTSPRGIAFLSSGSLFVADTGNNRVLAFAITGGIPSIFAPSISVPQKKTKTFKFTFANSSSASDIFSFTLQESSNRGSIAKSLTYSYNGADVTSSLRAGTFAPGIIAGGSSFVIVAKVTIRNKAKGKFQSTLSASSHTFPASSASGTATVTVKK